MSEFLMLSDKEGEFFKAYDEVMTATKYIPLQGEDAGKEVRLDLSRRVIWCYFLKRYEFFKQQGKEWFENQDVMAEALGVDRKTIQRFISEMVDAGYIIETKKTIRGAHKSNSYTITQPLQLVGGKKKAPKPKQGKEANKNYTNGGWTVSKNSTPVNTNNNQFYEEDDYSELPF